MKKMYSAAEIAMMNLPNLPKSATNVRQRADREGWASSEQTGLGGVRKVFEIPARYLVTVETMGLPLETAVQAALSAHKAAIAMGNLDDEQFIGLFKVLCGISQTAEVRESKSANTRRAKANASTGGVAISGDGDNKVTTNRIKNIKGDVKL